MNKQSTVRPRNWFLVFIATLLVAIGLVLIYLAVTDVPGFGWWSVLIGLSGLTLIFLSVMSIIKNDPSWLLLGLVIPG